MAAEHDQNSSCLPPSPPPYERVDLSDSFQCADTQREILEQQLNSESDSPKTFPRRSISTTIRGVFTESWVAEVLAWILACACVATIVVILTVFRNKELAHWHSRITLNTLINFLSQFAQSTLGIAVASSISQMKWIMLRQKKRLKVIDHWDEASRQPFQCTFLLFRYLKMLIVYLIIVNPILIILLGPFAQQSLALVQREVAANDLTAFVYSVSKYSIPDVPNRALYTNQNGTQRGFEGSSIDARLANEITIAISESEAGKGGVSTACPTENCTFPIYTTLGVCSAVEDVTSLVAAMGKGCSLDQKTQNFRQGTPFKDCRFTLPELEVHPPINESSMLVMIDEVSVRASALQFNSSNPRYRALKVLPLSNADGPLLSEFYIFYPNFTMHDQLRRYERLLAFKGVLRLCLYTLENSNRSGRTDTKIISIEDKPTWRAYPGQVANEMGTGNYTIFSGAGTMNPRLAFNTSFGINNGSRDSITIYLAEKAFYSTHRLASISLDRGYSWDFDPAKIASRFARAIYDNETNARMLRSDRKDSVKAILDDVALRMTHAMPMTAAAPTRTNGTAFRSAIFIDPKMLWMTLPVLSVLSALLLLTIVITQSKYHGVPAWKSSQIRTMTMFSPHDYHELAQLNTVEMRETEVQLKKNEEGSWALERQDGRLK